MDQFHFSDALTTGIVFILGQSRCFCYSILVVRGSCPMAARSRNKIVQKKTTDDEVGVEVDGVE